MLLKLVKYMPMYFALTIKSKLGPQTWDGLKDHCKMVIPTKVGRRQPLGGTSVFSTTTIPFRTADRLMRFSANDTHCPASATVTFALHCLISACEVTQICSSPFSLHGLHRCTLEVSIWVWANVDIIPRFYGPAVHNSIDNSANVWYRPNIGDAVLQKVWDLVHIYLQIKGIPRGGH